LSRFLAIGIAALLGACGFHLQGALITPPQMERTYIATDDRRSLFYRQLVVALDSAGVDVVENSANATATLTISYDETDQRVLSVSARNVPTEYEVYYTIAYSLDSGRDNLLDTQTLTVTRDYTYDSTLVLGKGREQELLREALVDDLVRIVLKQISAI
jgi:LPS-assembly lipoprotein